jgi:protein gp37
LIEKWAKIGAIEMVVNGTFTKETYQTISNLPLKDYQLLTKRIQELMFLAQNVTSQNDSSSNDTPGI